MSLKDNVLNSINTEDLKLNKYNYSLPSQHIAHYPLKDRDQSRLLVYKNRTIRHTYFHELSNFLESGTTLVFNDTKVIPARLFFTKNTGSKIEILLLQPKCKNIDQAFNSQKSADWICLIRNLRRWKNEILTKKCRILDIDVYLKAELLNNIDKTVRFTWETKPETNVLLNFGQIIDSVGILPLPPYIKREVEKSDTINYQTVYSRSTGAIAAPTAGLHFTKTLLKRLKNKQFNLENLTLWVGLGTFKPVLNDNILKHDMHKEYFSISRKTIENLAKQNIITAVGTTSLRTLESLYWFALRSNKNYENIDIKQFEPYINTQKHLSYQVVFSQLAEDMKKENRINLQGYTSIFIFPPYRFRVCKALITNFHFPKSTLLMLIAAFVGDNWKMIYDEALEKNYRFLSYGDSSLLFLH